MTNLLQEMSIAALLDAFEYHEKPEVIRDELIRRRKEAGFESLEEYLFVRDRGANDQGMTFQELFALGMKRHLPELLTCEGPSFDVGSSGRYQVPGAVALGRPDWVHPRDPIPAADDSVATIHAYHFIEHLSGNDVVSFMREVERVLIPEKGVLNFSMPHFKSELTAHTLDHKSLWTEETFSYLFNDDTYENFGRWRLRVHFAMAAGVAFRNLCVIGQVIKSDKPVPQVEKWFYPQKPAREGVPEELM